MNKNQIICIPGAGPRGRITDVIPLIPESHLLFAGAQACARHGLNSGELYRKAGRISVLQLELEELASGAYLRKIRDAAAELAGTLHFRALVVHMSCPAAVAGTDFALLQAEMEAALGVPVRCSAVNRLYMYEKRSKQPMQVPSIEETVFSFLSPSERNDTPVSVNLIGSILPPDRSSVLLKALEQADVAATHLAETRTFAEFRSMAGAKLNLCTDPMWETAAEELRGRLHIPWLPLYLSYDIASLREQHDAIQNSLGLSLDAEPSFRQMETLLDEIAGRLRGGPVTIDGAQMTAPYSLARALVGRGVNVKKIVCTRFTGREPAHRKWLVEHAPDVALEQADRKMGRPPRPPKRAARETQRTGLDAALDDLTFLRGRLE